MNADLTDRGIKLLYRQRGSRSRHVGHESDDSWPVIRGPATPENNGADEVVLPDEPFEPLFEQHNGESFQEVGQEPFVVPEQEFVADVPQPVISPQDLDDTVSYYNFQNMPLRQLSSSITSITSIDVLISMLSNLFENDLIPQAVKEFEASQDKHSKMMYKLDVRIFESILEQLVKDFKDILDINMSNNELCYQLKQLVMAKEDLNEELVQVRRETQELKCGGEWYQLQQEQTDLNDRVKLNEQLNQLSATLTGENPVPFQPQPLVTNELISDFCDAVNPYSGVVARLESLNKRLRRDSISE